MFQKTIYQFFKDKHDVVFKVCQSHLESVFTYLEEITKQSSDAIEEFVRMGDFLMRVAATTNQLMEEIRARMDKYPGVVITADKNRNGPPVGKPINLEVSGENYVKLIALAQGLQQYLADANIPGVEELKSDLETGKPELMVHIDREKARRFGLSTSQIATELRTALFGSWKNRDNPCSFCCKLCSSP